MLYNVPVRRYKNPNHMGVLQKMYSMISYWLKYYRHECGLTQQQVADRLKIERSTYTYYETGKTKPDINTLIKMGVAQEDETQKYRTHATTKYEVELLFVVRNLNPKQRKEVMNMAKEFIADKE